MDELLIASITSSCIKEPVIMVRVALALMKVRIPNSLNKSLFTPVLTTAFTSAPVALSTDKIPPASGRTDKPFIRSLRFIIIY